MKFEKSFYDWCIDNNRMDLNDRFDENKNGCTTKDIGCKSNLKYWFSCPRHLHDSELYTMSFVTQTSVKKLECRKCNSVAQVIIDQFGEDYLWDRWRSDNEISPWDIPHGSKIMVKLQCVTKDYHKYEQIASSFASGVGCPYCINRCVHPNDSLAVMCPEVLHRWSDKNTKTPYDYAPYSDKKAWFTCPEGVHDDYCQTISNAHMYGFTCRKCETAKWGLEHRGANNSSWRGGVTEDSKLLRKRREYVEWRQGVYERDSYTCQCCGSYGGRLNAHHLNSFSSYPELRLDINNGLTLCEKCHDATEVGSLHYVYGTHDVTPDMLRQYILNKANKDIYVTNPNLLYQISLSQDG